MNNPSGVIVFNGYRLQRIEYDCTPAFDPLRLEGGAYHFSMGHGSVQFEDKSVQINLLVRVFYSNDDDYDDAPFKLAIELAGRFAMADGSTWEDRWLPNAIAILYPYARAIIGSLTSQSGRDPIVLPTINTQTLL